MHSVLWSLELANLREYKGVCKIFEPPGGTPDNSLQAGRNQNEEAPSSSVDDVIP
jgi:hypothetical protein